MTAHTHLMPLMAMGAQPFVPLGPDVFKSSLATRSTLTVSLGSDKLLDLCEPCHVLLGLLIYVHAADVTPQLSRYPALLQVVQEGLDLEEGRLVG